MRFEQDGVLVSFAVPKRLPEEPGVRHLAVNTEDHPLDYLTFSGSIPAGEYGGGEVRLFDLGTYEPLEVADGKLTVRLHGTRYRGPSTTCSGPGTATGWSSSRARCRSPSRRRPRPTSR